MQHFTQNIHWAFFVEILQSIRMQANLPNVPKALKSWIWWQPSINISGTFHLFNVKTILPTQSSSSWFYNQCNAGSSFAYDDSNILKTKNGQAEYKMWMRSIQAAGRQMLQKPQHIFHADWEYTRISNFKYMNRT